MIKLWCVLFLFGLSSSLCFSQGGFVFTEGERKDKIPFQLVKNLIIIPVELNGLKLSFLLDTGVETTVLLGLNRGDSIQLKDAKRIELKGLGEDDPLQAFISDNNTMKIGKTINKDLQLYTVFDSSINFSPQLGVPVHGIIGYDFFKNFVVKIDYPREFIKIYDPEEYDKEWRSYTEIPLMFYSNKPYISAEVSIYEEPQQKTFLLDTGLGDALWLFSKNGSAPVPENSFRDFLGFGFIGDIYGRRSKVKTVKLADYKLHEVTAAFPDSTSIKALSLFSKRDGSIGAEILKRFKIVLSYPTQKIYLKKSRFFNEPFHYNMSGIILEHTGFIITETYNRVSNAKKNSMDYGKTIHLSKPTRYKKFALRPEYRITKVRPGSPAALAGVKPGDIILSINGKKAYRYELDEIESIFASKAGKKIRLKIIRNGEEMEFKFELAEII